MIYASYDVCAEHGIRSFQYGGRSLYKFTALTLCNCQCDGVIQKLSPHGFQIQVNSTENLCPFSVILQLKVCIMVKYIHATKATVTPPRTPDSTATSILEALLYAPFQQTLIQETSSLLFQHNLPHWLLPHSLSQKCNQEKALHLRVHVESHV